MDWIVNEFVWFLTCSIWLGSLVCNVSLYSFVIFSVWFVCVCILRSLVGTSSCGDDIVTLSWANEEFVCDKRKNKNHSNLTSTLCLPFCLAHFHQFGVNFQFHQFPAIDCSIDYSLAVLQFDLEFPLLQNHCHFCQHQNQTARRCDCFHSFLVPKFHRRMFQRPRSLVIKRQNKNELNNRPNQSAHGWNERNRVDERDWFFNVHKKDKNIKQIRNAFGFWHTDKNLKQLILFKLKKKTTIRKQQTTHQTSRNQKKNYQNIVYKTENGSKIFWKIFLGIFFSFRREWKISIKQFSVIIQL